MLTKRIIPCLDVDRGRVVKGFKFFDHVDAGDPVEQAKRYQTDGADELVFYDITASHEGRGIMADLVSKVVEQCFMPLCVGGGIRTLDDATRLIQAGAEKVSLNSAAVKNPKLIQEISRKFGRCATVLGLDANRITRDGVEHCCRAVARRRIPVHRLAVRDVTDRHGGANAGAAQIDADQRSGHTFETESSQ